MKSMTALKPNIIAIPISKAPLLLRTKFSRVWNIEDNDLFVRTNAIPEYQVASMIPTNAPIKIISKNAVS